jgi:hypothetical protein
MLAFSAVPREQAKADICCKIFAHFVFPEEYALVTLKAA